MKESLEIVQIKNIINQHKHVWFLYFIISVNSIIIQASQKLFDSGVFNNFILLF